MDFSHLLAHGPFGIIFNEIGDAFFPQEHVQNHPGWKRSPGCKSEFHLQREVTFPAKLKATCGQFLLPIIFATPGDPTTQQERRHSHRTQSRDHSRTTKRHSLSHECFSDVSLERA